MKNTETARGGNIARAAGRVRPRHSLEMVDYSMDTKGRLTGICLNAV